MNAAQARRAVDHFLEGHPLAHANGSPAYVASVAPRSGEENAFTVTFSAPRAVEPIPRAVAHVVFYVRGTPEQPSVAYRIENETSLRTEGGGGAAFSKAWIDSVIARKMRMKEFFDCRTDFDNSRWTPIHEVE